MNILTYVALAPETPKLFGRSFQSLMRVDWPHKMDIVLGRKDNAHPRKYVDLCMKHNEARDMVLAGTYDALLLVENDMIIPPDTITRLTAVDADVAYGLYCSRHGWMQWLAFFEINGLSGGSYSQSKKMMQYAWGNVVETRGVGFGCTLIYREVLKRINFRTHPQDAVADDWLFAQDCHDAGFKQAHDFGVVCGHIKPNGTVIWPNPEAEGGYQVEFPENSGEQLVTADNPLTVNVGMSTVSVHGRRIENGK